MPTGTVIRLDSASCIVQCEGRSWRCTLPGRWRLTNSRQIAVGDQADFSAEGEGDPVVQRVLPRHGGKLARRAAGGRDAEQVVAANVDQLVAVASAASPPLNRRLLDRLIVSAENGEMAATVCINKIDLADAAVEPVLALYRSLGYGALATSALTGEGIEALRETLRGKTSVLAGASGVGKSALLMAVQPGLQLRVGEVSAATGKGRHTTTAVSLLPLDFGGYVVDTPGIREFALWDLAREDLQHCFPELRALFGQCRFADCSHLTEPGCAVEAGAIAPERYESYRHIYESLPAADPAGRRR